MMYKVLYLSFSGYSDHSGISKKKLAQVKGLKECGCSVINCFYTVDYESGNRFWMVDEIVLANLGFGFRAKIRKRIDYNPITEYILKKKIELVYMRSDHNANPFLIRFIRKLKRVGVKTVMEIPTYPYDQEYITFKSKCHLFIDKVFRKQLAKELHAIVTFSNKELIFGQRTIRISNGIDFDSLRLKRKLQKGDELHLIGVAEIHYWHGFDRIVTGLVDYYNERVSDLKVFFHIVGEFSGEREKNDIVPLVEKHHLENYVILHGLLYGNELDQLFDQCDLGIGSLGRHRSNIEYIKTLKNREYAARGIPLFIQRLMKTSKKSLYSENTADESPVDIKRLIDFKQQVVETHTN